MIKNHNTELGEIEIDWPVIYKFEQGLTSGDPDIWTPDEEEFSCSLTDVDIIRLVNAHVLPICRRVYKDLIGYRDNELIKDVRRNCDRGEKI